jgi:hypothetical protein
MFSSRAAQRLRTNHRVHLRSGCRVNPVMHGGRETPILNRPRQHPWRRGEASFS